VTADATGPGTASETVGDLLADVAVAPAIDAPPVAPAPAEGRARRAWRFVRADRRLLFGLAYLALVVAASVLAPLYLQDPVKQDLDSLIAGPSGEHWLGTDDLGRDVLSRLVHGAFTSLLAASLAVGVAAVIGVTIGIVAGFFGGALDAVIMRLVDTLLAFPGLVLAVGVVAMLGPGLLNAMTAVGLVFSPVLARIVRAQVLSVRESLFVDASRTFGSSPWQIIRRHILPNALPPIIVQLALLFAVALLAEAGLSFIGLGVQPPDPSWGSMLGRAYRFMRQAPLQVVIVGLVIMLTALAFNAIGDALRDALDPRRRRGRPGVRT
jgi:peptide/nickel transport system permease protein